MVIMAQDRRDQTSTQWWDVKWTKVDEKRSLPPGIHAARWARRPATWTFPTTGKTAVHKVRLITFPLAHAVPLAHLGAVSPPGSGGRAARRAQASRSFHRTLAGAAPARHPGALAARRANE